MNLEQHLKSPNRLRWERFLKQRRSVLALLCLAIMTLASLGAGWIANSKPVLLSYKGELFFPVLKDPHPSKFGITDRLRMDYRSLPMSDSDWALWPPVRWDPYETNISVDRFPSDPTVHNPLGTDDRGRDVFARLLYGFRFSMGYAIIVWALSSVVAVILGGLMGYLGGTVDIIGQRIVEILHTIPIMFLLIILVSIFKPSMFLLILITVFFGWLGLSGYIRGEFLKNRKRDFVEAARALGAGHSRIIFTHILPNSILPILTFSPFIIAGHVYGLAALDYLGFGLPPPTPSWGELLSQAQKYFRNAWWLAVFPSGTLFSTLVLLALVGDGVRNAFETRD
jgi:microcin C transport system permease protein